jgi:hypothetical protein
MREANLDTSLPLQPIETVVKPLKERLKSKLWKIKKAAFETLL